MTEERRRAAAGTDSGSESVRAAGAGHIAVAAAGIAGGSGAGGPWGAAPSPRGSAQAGQLYRRVIRQRCFLQGSIRR
jgi:hypothetical protein